MFQVVLQIETRDRIGLFLLDAAVGKNVPVCSLPHSECKNHFPK